MTRKALNWLIFSICGVVLITVAALTLPKLIADEMYPVPPEFLAKVDYCKQRFDLAIDNALVLAVAKQESGIRMNMAVQSYAGAQGPMQVMPATAAGLRAKYGTGDLDAVTENICHGVLYIAGGLGRYQDDPNKVEKALAAYNGGPGAAAGYPNNMPSQTVHYVDIISNVYYPAYQQRLAELTGTSDFAQKKEKLSYFEQIMGALVGDYVTNKNLTDTSKVKKEEETPIIKTLKFISKPFYVEL